MPLNPFDDAIDELPQQAATPAAGTSKYDAFIDEHGSEQDARVRTTTLQAGAMAPDRAAETRKYADRFGFPPSVIEGNFDAFKQRAQVDDAAQTAKAAPALGAWLAKDPANAAVAQDDLAPLSKFDRTLGYAHRLIADPAISLLQSAISLPETVVGLADIVSLGHVGKFLDETVGYQPELAKNILATYYSKAQQNATRTVHETDGLVATAVSALSNPSVIVHSVLQSSALLLSGAAAGAALPFLGAAAAGAVGEGAQQAGSAAEQSRAGSESGLITLKQAALATSSGVVTGAIGMFGGRLAAKLGIADVDTMIAGGAVSATARRGLVAQIVYGAVEEGFVEEFPQSISEQIHQNVADGRPWMEGVNEAAVLGAFAGAVMGGGGNAIEQAQEHFLKEIGEVAKESKTVARSPAAAEDFLASALKDGSLEHVYAPIDTFTTYWQGQGQDPAAIAEALTGDPAAYGEAVATNEDLVIPTARYITQLAATEHHAFFEQELRISPDLQNAREKAAFDAEQAAKDTTTTDAAPTPREQMRAALTQQLTASGYLPRDADANARLVEAGIGTMAEAAGEDPFAVYQSYGLEVQRPDLAAAAPAVLGPAAAPLSEVPPAVAASVAAEPAAPAAAAAPGMVSVAEHEAVKADLRDAQRALDTDPLTGVASGRALDRALKTAEADPNTSVVVFDANNFGKVNKVTGSMVAGDAVIKQVADAITQAATEFGYGERVFRPHEGGDEFVVLAPTTIADDIRARAEAIFGVKGFEPRAATADLEAFPGFNVSLSGHVGADLATADASLQAVKAARKRSEAWQPSDLVVDKTLATPHTTGATDVTPLEIGDRPADAEAQRPHAEAGGLAEGEGDQHGAPAGRLPTPGLPDVDEVFTRQTLEQTAARLTPEVNFELSRILAELENLPYVPSTVAWLDEGPKDGNTAGGAGNVSPGTAGAPVYDDVLAWSPVNRSKGKPAKKARGTRAAVTQAVRSLIASGDVTNNLAEGALRVAEHRAAGDYSLLSPPSPASLSLPTPEGLVEDLAADYDAVDTGEGDVGEFPPPAPLDETAQALSDLQAKGVAYGPGGLRVRVVPTSGPDGEFELEITEKGQRTFEGKLSLEEAQAEGARRLAELAANPTKKPATPQIVPPRATAAKVKTAWSQIERPPTSDTGRASAVPQGEASAFYQQLDAHYSKLADRAAKKSQQAKGADAKRWARLAADWRTVAEAAKLQQQNAISAETPPAADDQPSTTPAETPIVEAAADEPEAEPERPVEPGPDAGAGDTGEPVGRPGDARAEALAAEQPDPRAPVSEQPSKPKRPRKPRPAAGGADVRAGATPAGTGTDAGASGGVHTAAHVDTADLAPDANVAAAEARGEQPRHFVIDDAHALTEGGWTAKLDANLAAIRLLKALEKEGRLATDAEQAVLARYIGWGHTNLAPIVDLIEASVRERDPRLQKARADLESLLTAAELRELGESTPNAHYSFNDLPRAMWAAIAHLGFTGGSILEPAVGSGHFLGTMPGALVADKRTRLWAVEKEPIAAGIARQLYQDTHVQTSPLQEANLPNDYYDLAVSNVPFGRISMFDPAFTSADRRPLTSAIHNYYFGKALDVVRPGGIIAFITSRYTMDARTDLVRGFLSQRADLLGAIRLPDQAFRATAGTDVVTDVIFLRKRLEGEAPAGAAWGQSVINDKLSTKERPIHTNEYFQAHPEQVLGTQNLTGKMARTSLPQYNVQGTVQLGDVIAAAERGLPANVYKPSSLPPRTLAAVISRDVKQGSFQIEKGELFLYDQGTLAPAGLTGMALARALTFVPLRDAYQGVLDTMNAGGTDVDLKKGQAALLKTYKAFVAEHGRLNIRENRKVIELDPNAGRILALEEIEVTKGAKGRPAVVTVTGLAEIFSKRTVVPVIEATTVGSPALALTQSLAWKGQVDLGYMQGLTGQTAEQMTAALEGQIFRDPVTQVYAPRAEYLSGDVTTKLAQARAAAATDATYETHVAELTKVLPVQFTPEDFPAPFGATWVPIDTYRAFLRDETHVDVDIKLTNTEARVKYYVDAGYGQHEFLPEGARFGDWIAAALNGEMPQVYTAGPTKGSTVLDVPATEAYRESLQQLRERWAEWWPGNPDASDTLTKIYNGMFNRDAPYVADGSHLVIPNANPQITLRPWQKNVVWRTLQAGNTLMAHAVGAGKTFAMIAIAGEWKRQGLANKPMIVAPNHLTEQWLRAFIRFYPGAKVLVPTKDDFTPGNRQRLIARIANNDWDAVVMAQSQFLSVSVKEATLRAFITEQENQLLADGAAQMSMSADEFATLVTEFGAGDKVAVRALSSRNAPRSAKDIARAILTLRGRLQKRLDQNAKRSPVTFEELGVDGLLIDEAHLYKNLYFSTAKNNIAGLKGSDAGRAMDMFLKVRHINQASNGRNVVFATGTPVSNAISELYTMFRYLAQPQLDRLGMSGFDSWSNGNAEARGEMEPSPGGGYKERIRLRKWTNLRELSAQFRKFADVVSTEDLVKSGEITLPTTKGGSPTVVALDPHADMAAYTEELRDRIEALKSGKVDPKDDNHLLITTQAALSAIDMRLVRPGTAFDPKGRISIASQEIASRYRATTATNGVQLAFLDVGVPNAKQMPPLPASVIGKAAAKEAAKAAKALEAEAATVDEDDEDIVDLEAEGEAAMDGIRAAGSQIDLYGELRRLLVAEGIPDDEIAYVHQAITPYEQGKLFAAVSDGRVRVLIGSTAKGGTGMNVQQKMVAIHHLDVPWRPADVEQRNGRIYRQGNENSQVDEVRYVTKKSFDEYRWGLLATKQASIVALMKGELTSMDDVDPAQLDMQVAQALASGDPRTLEMLNKEREVKALQTRYLAFTRRVNSARRAVTSGQELIGSYSAKLEAMTPLIADAQAWAKAPTVALTTAIARYGGANDAMTSYDAKDTDSRKALQQHIERLMASEPYEDDITVGEAGPFDIRLLKSTFDVHTGKELISKTSYYLAVNVELDGKRVAIGNTPEWWVSGKQATPNFVKSLDAYLDPTRLTAAAAQYQASIAGLEQDVARQQEIAAKPFTQIDLLQQRERELSDLRVELGISRGTPAADVAPAAAEGKSFDQPLQPVEPEGRRGNIRFGVDPLTGRTQTTISLPPNADLSTFLHETGHFFLEVFGDLVDKVEARDPATRTRSQTRLLDDYGALLQELGVTRRSEIGTAQHEQLATWLERYLMAGDAPSVELQSTFARFRGWLLAVYKALKNVGTPVSPELAGLFDRMLAGEDAIDEAERDAPPLFTSADQAGMNPQQFAQYRTAMEEAHRTTRETLDKQIAAEVREEQSATRQADRAELETHVRSELQQEPVYVALAAMLTGTKPDGTSLLEGQEAVPLTLAREPLVARYGEAFVNALPAGLVGPVGTSPDFVARFVGFSSGDEMLQAVMAAAPLESAIAAETDKRMLAKHGTMVTDGSLHERARAAVANTDRDALIRAEVKALWQKRGQSERAYERRWLEAEAKLRVAIAEGHKQVEIDALTTTVQDLKAKARGGAATIRRALPSAATLKAAAEARVARTKLRDLKPALFWSAARQAAKRAVSLAATQDLVGAIDAKTQELVNLANHRATVAALTDSQERRAWVVDHDTTAARGRTGLAGADYLDQWDGMLDRFEFKKVSRKVLDRRAALAPWIAAQTAAGLPVLLPAIVLNDALRTNYQQLTVEQFTGVTDGLKSLIHLARLKLGLMRAGEQRSFEAVRDELADSILEKTPAKVIPLEFRGGTAAAWRSLESAVASHATLSTFGFQLDGNAYNGPFWEHLVRPANEAASAEETRNIASGTAYHAILEQHYPGRDVLSFADQTFIPAIQASLSKEARLAVAMNWGNATSRARVQADPSLHWTPLQIAAVLDTLEKRDWDFVQAHWDYLNTFWPEIAAKSQRLTGLPPEKVEAMPVDTKFGTYPGGYHPLVYDARKSSAVGQQAAVSEAKLAVAGAALHATTRRGHEETRLEDVRLPLRLDMAATTMHLSTVIHDLTHHEFLIDATRLLRDKKVAAAIHATRGAGVQQKLSGLMLDIASGDRAGGRPTLIENGAAWLRTRTQVAGLAWNLWTMLQQPLGIFNGMERVGIGWVAKGAGMWARDAVSMERTVSMILDKSDLMRARYGTATQDLHDLRQTLSVEGGWFDRLVRTVSADHATQQTILDSYMALLHVGQMFADKPTWLGEYLKQMDGDPLDEARAIAAADQAVLDSQGGGQIKDLAEVQRGGQVGKLFMTFASYSTMILNSTARAAGQTNFRSPASTLTFAGHLALLYVIPAFFTEMLRCGVGRARCNEVPQFLSRVGGQSLTTALNGILYLREAVAGANLLLGQDVGARGYAGPAGTRVFEVATQLMTQVHQGKIDKGLERAAFAASGLLFRYPAAQLQRSIDGWIALEEGKTHNPAALLFGPPAKAN